MFVLDNYSINGQINYINEIKFVITCGFPIILFLTTNFPSASNCRQLPKQMTYNCTEDNGQVPQNVT